MQRARYFSEMQKYGIKLIISPDTDADNPPLYADSQLKLLHHYYNEVKADGVYTTDYKTVQKYNTYIQEQQEKRAELPAFFSDLQMTLPIPSEKATTEELGENGTDKD